MTVSRKSHRPHSSSSARPHHHPHHHRLRYVAMGLALAFTVGGGLYAVAATRAVSAYQNRLSSSSFAFAGRLQFTGQDFLSPLNTDMSFSGRYLRDAPAAVAAQFLGNWAGKDYSGEARTTAGRLYFNLSGPIMPVIRYRQGSYLLPLAAGNWYSAKADESLYDNICAHTQPATLQSRLELYRTVRSLKLSPSPLVNFWASLGGARATRLSAALSGDQLASLWTAATGATPPGCGDPNTIGLSAADLKHVQAKVDLLTGQSSDHLVIGLTDKTLGATATLTLDTSDYGPQPPVAAPANVTDINALYAAQGLR